MNTRSTLRLAAATLLVGAAYSANAFVLTFLGTYTGTFLTNPNFTVDATIDQGLAGFNGFTVLKPATSASATGGTSSLATTLNSADGTKSLVVKSVTGTSMVNGTTTSFSGTWVGTQTGLNIANTGTYSGSYDGSNYSIALTGQPVPEPASFAALGVGALALVRRRRKA